MKNDPFKDYILDQLRDMQGVAARPMFGGFGLYLRGTFFGIISQDRLYFKTSVASRKKYEVSGMEPFQPNARQILKNYYKVPPEVQEDARNLAQWAEEAARV